MGTGEFRSTMYDLTSSRKGTLVFLYNIITLQLCHVNRFGGGVVDKSPVYATILGSLNQFRMNDSKMWSNVIALIEMGGVKKPDR